MVAAAVQEPQRASDAPKKWKKYFYYPPDIERGDSVCVTRWGKVIARGRVTDVASNGVFFVKNSAGVLKCRRDEIVFIATKQRIERESRLIRRSHDNPQLRRELRLPPTLAQAMNDRRTSPECFPGVQRDFLDDPVFDDGKLYQADELDHAART